MAQQFTPIQQHQLDSLFETIQNDNSHDTAISASYVALSEILYISNFDTIQPLCSEAKKIAEKNLNHNQLNKAETRAFRKTLASSVNNLGYYFGVRGNLKDELANYRMAFEMQEKIGDKVGMSSSLNNMGSNLKRQGNIKESLEAYLKSLIIKEELGNTRGMATTLGNIGIIYEAQDEIDVARDYYQKSLSLYQELGDKRGMGVAYNNLALMAYRNEDNTKSLDYNLKSLDYRLSIKDMLGVANSYNNIGLVYRKLGQLDSALYFYNKSVAIKRERGDRRGVPSTLTNIGHVYLIQSNLNKAIKFGEESLLLATDVGDIQAIKVAAKLLDESYSKDNRYKKAHKMQGLYHTMKDSLGSKKIKDEALKQTLKYEYGRQILADSLAYAEQQRIEELEHNRIVEKQRTYTYFGFMGLLLVLLFSFFVVNRLRVTRKQKTLIEHQKNIVEEAHQEIRDSINYAKRIQSAILPSTQEFKKHLPNSFVLYKPKDVVAGDFYWMESVSQSSLVLFAAADCTGHGVPGAMVSVVCNNALNRSVREYGLTNPGNILDKTREIVIQEFEKSDEIVKDGMDIALCGIEGNKLHYAGAHNPLWIIRKGELIETKANKQPIGRFDRSEPYSTHSVDLKQGDTIYIFSDGYVDQFGGEKGKKFKSKAFRTLLLSIQDKTMAEQKTVINETFEAWRGSLEQIDDVCVIGVRI